VSWRLGGRIGRTLVVPKLGLKVAAILSIMESCRRLKVSVRDYLAAVLPGLANIRIQQLPEVNPYAWRANACSHPRDLSRNHPECSAIVAVEAIARLISSGRGRRGISAMKVRAPPASRRGAFLAQTRRNFLSRDNPQHAVADYDRRIGFWSRKSVAKHLLHI
jgi:hypothetical protein